MAKGAKINGKASKITLDVLKDHFHLPMAEVAKKFNVCLTYFKRVCRNHGVNRWPYRKIKSHLYLVPKEDDYGRKRSPRAYHCDATEPDPSPLSEIACESASPPPSYSEEEDSDYVAADGLSAQTSSHGGSSPASPTLAPRSVGAQQATIGLSRKRKGKTVEHPDPYCALDILASAALADPPSKIQHLDSSKVVDQHPITFSRYGGFSVSHPGFDQSHPGFDQGAFAGTKPGVASSSTQLPIGNPGFALPPIQHLMTNDYVQNQQNYDGQVRHLIGQRITAVNLMQQMHASSGGAMTAPTTSAHLRSIVQATTEGGFPHLNGSHLNGYQQYINTHMVGGQPSNGMLRPSVHSNYFSPAHAGSSQEMAQMHHHQMNQMVW